MRTRSSEPVIADAPPVARQVFERVESVETVDRYSRNGIRLGEPKVDGDAPTSLLAGLVRAPESDATARDAEVEFDRLAAHVEARRPRHVDTLTLVAVSPENPVTAAYRAVADGRAVGFAFEAPAYGAAVAGSFDHRV